ncbi:hypothetical protein TVAGG3_1075450 [Trichomonas vaginalis G3]|uniref:uncharacterized protein n=1 Tax=Trichomonas vaginalis (strain ATCC PRA-98 / G3) TaxID=412133 RepID=UPI0021E52BCE|nr:uncharacterized protein TVAGG3_1075450 [Trichomonas vaginalis G3]KAI5482942.1 hypothetical protein TVAGG3_1075450 [Trichomonas vaginalis G3]
MSHVPPTSPFPNQRNLKNHNSLLSNLSSASTSTKLLQFPPQGYYPPQGFPNYPPLPMPYFPNPWMFQQAPPQQFQSQSKSKRDQEFEEGLNRLRKEYATAPIERKLFPDQKYNLG